METEYRIIVVFLRQFMEGIMKIEIDQTRFILIAVLQLIIIILFIWDYFRTKKANKFMTSEIKRLDNKIKTFGCVK